MIENDIQRVEARLRERANDLRWSRPVRRREQSPWLAEAARQDDDRSTARVDSPPAADCVDCGGQIGSERLRAVPQAVRCMACQRAVEAGQPQLGSRAQPAGA